jgi:oligopeptide/dipeptide ABC transporter ATP-binding protein
VGGEVLFHGENLLTKTEKEMRSLRGRSIAMVLQEPMTALNPVVTVGSQIAEGVRLHQKLSGSKLRSRAVELLSLLRVSDPAMRLRSYPHELSGGMRQRVVGAIALGCTPEVLIADEPTTALDVTVQAAYLELLKDIQRRSQLSIIFVTHDFSVVARMCDRVGVMYAGKLVEIGDTRTIMESPRHPYTEALLRSVPDVRERPEQLYSIEGAPPSIFADRPGCPFAPRCQYVAERCHIEFPPDIEQGQHKVSCWRHAA